MYQYKEDQKKSDASTGIPQRMKERFEMGTGVSLDQVKVVYNSSLPGKAGASSYYQDGNVYLGAGRERDLGHELGHAVQQMKGLVRPTGYINGQALNDDARLEQEADDMSRRYGE